MPHSLSHHVKRFGLAATVGALLTMLGWLIPILDVLPDPAQVRQISRSDLNVLGNRLNAHVRIERSFARVTYTFSPTPLGFIPTGQGLIWRPPPYIKSEEIDIPMDPTKIGAYLRKHNADCQLRSVGWPRPCAYGMFTAPPPGGFWITEGGVAFPGLNVFLPTTPLISGIAINWTFFAVICFAILLARDETISYWRQRKCQCEKCGYSLVGLRPDVLCPECGTSPTTTSTSSPPA